ncbi:MAG: alkylation repair protein [Bacillales bacterium]|jgi:3-methyladenine DNA glycosylase AlkD|nr:alkylation repair protein [Bacillales bacterium]
MKQLNDIMKKITKNMGTFMKLEEVLFELEAAGSERTKKTYIRNGAHEPLFGCAIKDLNPIVKKIKHDNDLAFALYNTGNYDAMYLAGMIVDVKKMSRQDFEDWIEKAYFFMLSDFVVAVCLVEADFNLELAEEWITSGDELKMSAGWSTFTWTLESTKDNYFNCEQIKRLLDKIEREFHGTPGRAKNAMNAFLISVGISYLPLHERAYTLAKKILEEIIQQDPKCKPPGVVATIENAIAKKKLGFKRNYLRC